MKTSQHPASTTGFHKKLWLFVLLAFLFSYLGLFLSWILFPVEESTSILVTYSGIFFTVMGPTLAAVLLSLRYEGPDGFKAILLRLKPISSQLSAYVLIPLMSLLFSLILFSFFGLEQDSIVTALRQEWQVLLGHITFQILVVGILEEIGWRGWMLTHLLKKYKLAKATLVLAPVWCLWHFPKLMGPFSVSGPFVLLSLSASVLLSYLWVYGRGNLFLLAIAHGSVNFPVFFLENLMEQGYLEQQQMLENWLVYALAYAVLAIFIVLLKPGIWFRHYEVAN